ncbi:MAG: transposase [Symbiobacteriaceae bacterium]|nr:transposase [Symbiobacteriaceae bacterium]
MHVDETGISAVNARWLHVVSSDRYTYYGVHEKRGIKAIHDIVLLENYHGVIVHDFWSSYLSDSLPGVHAMCNAHLLRELQGIIDNIQNLTWAAKMQEFLRSSWREVKRTRQDYNTGLPDQRVRELVMDYGRILRIAELEIEEFAVKQTRRRNAAKSDAERLWNRFMEFGEAILRFIYDPRVPFDNNLRERDLRMMKVKMKVCGTFRSYQGSLIFADLRNFISSARKQGYEVFSAISMMLSGAFEFA